MNNKLQLSHRARLQQQETTEDYEHRKGGWHTDDPIPLSKRLKTNRRLIANYEHILEITTRLLYPENAPEPPGEIVLTDEDRARMSQRVAANYQPTIDFYSDLLATARRWLSYLESQDTSSEHIEESEDDYDNFPL